jgi:predicted DNA-binding transcriptional regulator
LGKVRTRKSFADLIRDQGGGQRTVQSLDESRKIMDDLSTKLLEFSQPDEGIYQQAIEPSVRPITKPSTQPRQEGLRPDKEQGQTIDQTLDQIEDRTEDQHTIPSIRPKVTQTIYHSLEQRPYQTAYQTKGQPSSDFEIYPLTPKQLDILSFLVQKEKKITAMREIEKSTGISYNSVRKVLKLFFTKRFVIKQEIKSVVGSFQGFTYTINEPICKKLLQGYHAKYHTTGQTADQILGRYDTQSGPLLLVDDDSIKNPHLGNGDLADLYPKLYEHGFRSEHLYQVIKSWKVMKLDLDELHDSLEKAEWDVRENPKKMDKPLGYVLSALKRGSYTAPKGFKLRREIQAEERLAKAKKLEAMLEEEISSLFNVWWGSMTREEQRQIDVEIVESGEKGLAFASREETKMPFRRTFFRNNVFDLRRSQDLGS